MQSQTTEAFRKLLAAAPAVIQSKAQGAYDLWAKNPRHPSLRFKKVHNRLPIYAVRIDAHVIRPHECRELPDLTKRSLSRAVVNKAERRSKIR